MQKRGQISDTAMRYIIIVVVLIAIQGIGYYSFTSVREKMCTTDLGRFQIDAQTLSQEISDGSVEKKSFFVPCDVDEVYFVDSDEVKETYFANPFIRESIESKSEANVFLIKDGQVKESFNMGELDFPFPGYTCMESAGSSFEFFAQGKGRGLSLVPGCYQKDCTLIPQDIGQSQAQKILNEFFTFDCERCPTDILNEVQDYSRTLENLNVYRRYTYCPDTGYTKVEIIISPKEEGQVARNFRYYEFIPKECISDLNAYLESLSIEGEVFVQDDPLIMWQFDEITEETILEYTLNKTMMQQNCSEIIQGLGIAEMTQEEEVDDSLPPEIEELPNQTLVINQGETEAFSLNDFVDDDTTLSEDIEWTIDPTPQHFDVWIEE